MASASKTPNLNLPQWVATEKPEMVDFNAAFDAIDSMFSSGTWTPTLDGRTVAGNHTYTSREGTWTRIGNRVFLEGVIQCTVDTAASGNTVIDNLPFTIAGNTGNGYVSDIAGCPFVAGRTIGLTAFGNVKYMALKQIGTTSAAIAITALTSPFLIRFGASYITSD